MKRWAAWMLFIHWEGMMDDMTLREAFDSLYRRFRLAGKSASTSKNYHINIRHLDLHLGRTAMISDLTNETVIDGMQSLLDRGRGVVTANKFRVHMVALWSFLAKRGLIQHWPDVPQFTQPQRSPVGWSQQQLQRLFAALSGIRGTICGLPASEWHVCHHLWLWYTAERLTASLRFRVEDLDLDSGWAFIRAETRKGKTRDLRRRLPEAVLPRFRSFVGMDPGREFLFPIDVGISMVFKRYRKILQRAGLPSDRRSMYHRMRRSAVSHFMASGGDGSRLADHSNPKITRESYADPTIVIETQAADVLFLPLR